ncbi:MAG: GNAT family N-acetyltransferase [Labilithrix sp.]|nr:GNAT family N-acetyltransferase [Labilithrix sp.]MCW5813130.1 GNAT family N-acetyltransferase [Labilithrix sp.]
MLAWWDAFGDAGGRRLCTIAFYEGSRLVGLAPLLARPFVHPPRLRFRRLESLASGEDEADETCSEHLGLIAARGAEGAVVSAFARTLRDGRFGAWDELVIPGMNDESALTERLASELEARRLFVAVEERAIAPWIPLPRTWDEYLAQLDPPRRERLTRWLDALERWGAPALVRARTAEELAEARRVLEALHRAHHPGGGVYASARFRRFHERVMPELLALGALDAGWLSVRGEPIAAFYNLRWNGRAWHYQSGHARGVPEDVRVGVTLQALLVRAAIEDGLREYDFLAGVLDYKTALSLERRRLVTLRAARPSLVESGRRLTSLLRRVGKGMRHRSESR